MTDPDPSPGPFEEVAATGDRRATLEALRDRLAAAIDKGPPARDLAALSRNLRETLDELSTSDPIDEELSRLLSTPTTGEEGTP